MPLQHRRLRRDYERNQAHRSALEPQPGGLASPDPRGQHRESSGPHTGEQAAHPTGTAGTSQLKSSETPTDQ